MKIADFDLERWQSKWEHVVDVNLAESSVEGMPLEELLALCGKQLSHLAETKLAYIQTNGSVALRQNIAALYPGADEGNVQVTNGGSEANFATCWALLSEGDEMLVVTPNYPQVLGLAGGFGARLVECPLVPDFSSQAWTLDLDHLEQLASEKTRIIALCNPGNPTGNQLTASELDRIVAIAERHDSWILSDEIYAGAENDKSVTPSVWGRYDRVAITSGMSKAYGLPGLRIGWSVTTPEMAEELWRRRDYTTIAPTALGDRLATLALLPGNREAILERNRTLVARQYETLLSLLDKENGPLTWIEPRAGSFVFARYRPAALPSRDLAVRLRAEKSVLVAPGAHFGVEGFLRLGFGFDAEKLALGLARLCELLEEVGEETSVTA